MLNSLGGGAADGVLVGLDAPDDAAVYALDEDRAIISTLDFFAPIVDDPYFFGAIAAANALSDIYAMGGRPLFALNIVAFPVAELDHSILAAILRGGNEKAREAGIHVIGGHSIDDKEPKYGMVVVGTISPDRIYRKGGGRPGDRLVLTKAIGTGIVSTAIKRGSAPQDAIDAAVSSMTRLNAEALAAARIRDVGALTDVTGFGLLGHLGEVARLSELAAVVDSNKVPLLPHALDLAKAGCIPGGTRRNFDHVMKFADWPVSLPEALRLLLCDAQTSGGLLISVAAADSDALVDQLTSDGHAAAEIGELTAGEPGCVEIR